MLTGRWMGFLGRRLLGLVVVLAFLLLATFAMVRLIPGDPAVVVLGQNGTPEQYRQIDHLLGVDRPWPQQLAEYVVRALHGDFGTSFATKQPVGDLIRERIGPTAELAGLALAVVLLLSVPLGMVAAHLTASGRRPRLEVAWTTLTAVLGTMPQYLLATLLIFLFALQLRLLPVAGGRGWQALVLPVASLSLGPTLALARIVRLQVLDALAQDYVRTAESKRLPLLTIYVRHVLPNVLTTALTVGGLLFSSLIAGTIFIEQIFVRVGMGSSLIGAIQAHDYPVIQADVLVLGMTVVVVNTIVDILLGVFDPRTLATEG
ncbi:MAG TPA: ABC transporter permease [Candidatus Dormibacteraeota bacterium]|nr:ABC transporter permease [Candidatus Dormibacteraeota bacterium]